MSNYIFNLSAGQDEWIAARPEEPKRVSAGTGDLLLDRKPFPNGYHVDTSVPVTVTGPGKVTVTSLDPSDLPAPPHEPEKKKAKKKGKK
jgi:hypothetical protein